MQYVMQSHAYFSIDQSYEIIHKQHTFAIHTN